jgi:hypothetical protein
VDDLIQIPNICTLPDFGYLPMRFPGLDPLQNQLSFIPNTLFRCGMDNRDLRQFDS